MQQIMQRGCTVCGMMMESVCDMPSNPPETRRATMQYMSSTYRAEGPQDNESFFRQQLTAAWQLRTVPGVCCCLDNAVGGAGNTGPQVSALLGHRASDGRACRHSSSNTKRKTQLEKRRTVQAQQYPLNDTLKRCQMSWLPGKLAAGWRVRLLCPVTSVTAFSEVAQ
jgi:hypothetical protein